ncbi:MAG TPA: hypothetical protein VIG90_04005 [Pedomonas sp.]|uniref:hypothetical protein n=1 Tax=Pedomonas sp. TaxID=2976421 RepID=UPI002F402552
MFQHDKLNALFLLLKEMTLQVREGNQPARSKCQQRLEHTLLAGYIITVLTFAGLIAWHRLVAPLQNILMHIYGVLGVHVLCGLAYFTALGYGLYSVYTGGSEKRFSTMHALLENDLHSDSNFLAQLGAFDKAILEYGLIQYRHCWDSFDGRVSLLGGDLRKLGLFPAFAAATLSAASLLEQDSNVFLWVPLILAICFYLVVCVAGVHRERPQQVIALLEFAIRRSEDQVSISPSIRASARSEDLPSMSTSTIQSSQPATENTAPSLLPVAQ